MDSNVDINVLVDTKSYENILVYNILKLWLMLSLCILSSIKQMSLLEFMMELDILYYFEVKNMISFIAQLDILQV